MEEKAYMIFKFSDLLSAPKLFSKTSFYLVIATYLKMLKLVFLLGDCGCVEEDRQHEESRGHPGREGDQPSYQRGPEPNTPYGQRETGSTKRAEVI